MAGVFDKILVDTSFKVNTGVWPKYEVIPVRFGDSAETPPATRTIASYAKVGDTFGVPPTTWANVSTFKAILVVEASVSGGSNGDVAIAPMATIVPVTGSPVNVTSASRAIVATSEFDLTSDSVLDLVMQENGAGTLSFYGAALLIRRP